MPNIVLPEFTPVVLPTFSLSDYYPIDLSVNNSELDAFDLANPVELKHYIGELTEKHNVQILYGGYLEKRNLYKKSTYFTDSKEQRDIHLGVDFWCPVDSPVVAPFDGVVHSFNNNTNNGDYGPTLIIQHIFQETVFYTLYGHLSVESIRHLKVNQPIRKGEIIAYLGDASVNGGYAPHLHFQLILDMGEYKGDFPGVCSEDKLSYYKEVTINPLHFLSM